MEIKQEKLTEFTAPYLNKRKHRAKCRVCKKLIRDGESTRFAKIKSIKYYPVKGLMGFVRWVFAHEDCASLFHPE